MISEDYLENIFSLSECLQKGKILVSIFSYPRFTGLVSREIIGKVRVALEERNLSDKVSEKPNQRLKNTLAA